MPDHAAEALRRVYAARHPQYTVIVQRRELQPADTERIAAFLHREFDTRPRAQHPHPITDRDLDATSPGTPDDHRVDQI